MKAAILVVLVLILLVLGGIFWNQRQERADRLKREAAIELAQQQEAARLAAEKKAHEERNEQAIRDHQRREAELDKKLEETFGY